MRRIINYIFILSLINSVFGNTIEINSYAKVTRTGSVGSSDTISQNDAPKIIHNPGREGISKSVNNERDDADDDGGGDDHHDGDVDDFGEM